MAKYNVEDKVVLLEVYMDGWFVRKPQPRIVKVVDDVSETYVCISPNQSQQYVYTFKYLDNNYRLANLDELSLF